MKKEIDWPKLTMDLETVRYFFDLSKVDGENIRKVLRGFPLPLMHRKSQIFESFRVLRYLENKLIEEGEGKEKIFYEKMAPLVEAGEKAQEAELEFHRLADEFEDAMHELNSNKR